MPDYIHPDWLATLQGNGMATFDQLWNLQVEWVENPNADRGGASGVGRVQLQLPQGGAAAVYLKRQRSHTRRTWRHPLRGEPTFAREFKMLRHLRQHQVMAPTPVFYGERVIDGEACAILVTEELAGYRSLEEMMEAMARGEAGLALIKRRQLLGAAAAVVSAMHASGVQHRSLYPKHIFIKDDGNGYAAALIDLEKSRFSYLLGWRTIQDLATLNYRTPYWSRASRLYFFKHYHAVASMSWWQRWQCRLIQARSAKKLERLKKIYGHG